MTDDEKFDKILGQFRLNLGGIMKPLRLYGQGDYVDSVIREAESLAIQLHQKLSGIDEPFHINNELLHW